MSIVYNPEGSALRRDQLELFKMLQNFDIICKRNNIQWWLSSGTLLGAARHQGFIPWDDDMDIVMMRDDYKRLVKILKKTGDTEYVLHCQETDIDYINVFGKYRKRQGRVSSPSRRYQYYKWAGIGFDVFHMEKTSLWSAKTAHSIYHILQKPTEYISVPWVRKPLIKFIEYLCDFLIFPILRLIGKYNPNEEYHYSLGSGWPKHTFFEKNIYPIKTTIFEGKQMPVPINMDEYLTLVYGNWRKLPSEDIIKHSIHCQEYRDEIFGKENKKND